MKKKQISIKEIARLSGVSIATVSRIINNNGRFSEETRQKVEKIIAEHHYQTNNIAKSLRMNISLTIGVIVPDINNEFFSVVVQEIERLFFDKGYSTIICNTAKSEEKEKEYLKVLEAKMVDGLICISGQEKLMVDILKRDVPIVCIDRRPKIDSKVAFIESDNYQGGILATEELIEKGCQRILLLTKKRNLSSVNERVNGYQQALKKHGLSFDPGLVIRANDKTDNLKAAKDAIEKTLAAGIPFDGVFATNDWLALGTILTLQEKGIQIPEQVKVVGFDNDTIASYCGIPITTIHQDKVRLAEEAVDALMTLMTSKEPLQETHKIVPVSLIQRKSTER